MKVIKKKRTNVGSKQNHSFRRGGNLLVDCRVSKTFFPHNTLQKSLTFEGVNGA